MIKDRLKRKEIGIEKDQDILEKQVNYYDYSWNWIEFNFEIWQ